MRTPRKELRSTIRHAMEGKWNWRETHRDRPLKYVMATPSKYPVGTKGNGEGKGDCLNRSCDYWMKSGT